jgi:chemotaxis response regulator CheB
MRIAIVNDMAMAVEGLKRIIQLSSEHQVAWIAWTGEEAVQCCAADLPDLILMDLIMPDMNGVEATRQIMQSTPCPIIVVTASVDGNSAMVFEALGEGAIDAINTPLLVGDVSSEQQKALLHKIAMIGVLTRANSSSDSNTIGAKFSVQANARHEQIVVIGASSGGPHALSILLKDIPRNFSAPIVVVQHVDQQFVQGLADWLDQQVPLSVVIAQQGDQPTPGKIFLAGSDKHLVMLETGKLGYQSEPADIPYKPSVDVFWHSLYRNWKGTLTAILLTGMGKDGAAGMLALRQKGALTIAQDEATSTVYGMPKAAIDLEAAVEIWPIEAIGAALLSRHNQA